MDCRLEHGFVAKPFGKNLFHWYVRIFGTSVGAETPLGVQLMEWSLANSNLANSFTRIEPKDIVIELLFPPDFPNNSPLLRIVSPRFKNTDNLAVSKGVNQQMHVSHAIEKQVDWKHKGIVEIVREVREQLMDKQVDVEAGDVNLSTVGEFWMPFKAFSPTTCGNPSAEKGGRIILPASSLAKLYEETNQYGWRQNSDGGSPMIFELSSDEGLRSFCGVVEFSAQEGTCCVPKWMMRNLRLNDGENVHVRRVTLPKGTFLRLQPHDAKFLEVKDTKAMLEWVLSHYTAVASGDNLVVNYRHSEYQFNVIETKPGHAIRIIGCDIPVDFAPPLSGEELPKSLQGMVDEEDQSQSNNNAGNNNEQKPPEGQKIGQYIGEDSKQCENCRYSVYPKA